MDSTTARGNASKPHRVSLDFPCHLSFWHFAWFVRQSGVINWWRGRATSPMAYPVGGKPAAKFDWQNVEAWGRRQASDPSDAIFAPFDCHYDASRQGQGVHGYSSGYGMINVLLGFVVLALLPLPTFAQANDAAYCAQLGELAVRYAGSPSGSGDTRPDVAIIDAIDSCNKGDTAKGIKVLEEKLRNNGFTLPKRTAPA